MDNRSVKGKLEKGKMIDKVFDQIFSRDQSGQFLPDLVQNHHKSIDDSKQNLELIPKKGHGLGGKSQINLSLKNEENENHYIESIFAKNDSIIDDLSQRKSRTLKKNPVNTRYEDVISSSQSNRVKIRTNFQELKYDNQLQSDIEKVNAQREKIVVSQNIRYPEIRNDKGKLILKNQEIQSI